MATMMEWLLEMARRTVNWGLLMYDFAAELFSHVSRAFLFCGLAVLACWTMTAICLLSSIWSNDDTR